MTLKQALKQYTPFASKLLPIYHGVRKQIFTYRLSMEDRKQTFSRIYKKNHWKDKESRSGAGSNMEQTRIIRETLPKLIAKYKITSLLDIPCGDFYWMKQVDKENTQYIGGDIVEEMINENNKFYQDDRHRFIHADMCLDSLPDVDMIFCRDALVHLSFEDIDKAVKNFKKTKAKYLFTTTFSDRNDNKDILTGDWRTLNLAQSPFNFPEPLEIFNENCPDDNGRFSDKSIALWRISDLPDTIFKS